MHPLREGCGFQIKQGMHSVVQLACYVNCYQHYDNHQIAWNFNVQHVDFKQTQMDIGLKISYPAIMMNKCNDFDL